MLSSRPLPARLRWVILPLLVLYWTALFTATHLPPRDAPSVGVPDKLLHFLAYGGLGFLLVLSATTFRPLRPRAFAALLAILAIYGILDELLQSVVARTPELFDWLADLAGGLAGMLAAGLMLALLDRWRSGRAADAVPSEEMQR